MSTHANDITVGAAIHGRVTVDFRGELSRYVAGLRRYVAQAEGITDAVVVEGQTTIIVDFKSAYKHDTPEQARIRIRNRCRDYLGDVTGYMTNMSAEGSHADLIEHATPALV